MKYKVKRSEIFWDKISENFDKGEKRFENIHLSVIQNTKQYLKPNDNLLDYGCGTGIKSIELANSVRKVLGIDISSRMIEIAKKKANERKIENVQFRHILIQDSGLLEDSYDVILAFNILHLLKENQEVIKKINKLLKKGGLFISATPCLKERKDFLINLQFFFSLILSKIGLIPIFLKKFSRIEIENLMTSNKFQIVFSETIYHKLSNLFMVVKKI